VRPVSLRLFAWQCDQPQERFSMRRAQARNNAALLDYAAGVPAPTDHLVDPGRAQARVSLECLLDEVQIWLDQRCALRRPPLEPIGIQCASNGVRM
jgi:hypothetical protein